MFACAAGREFDPMGLAVVTVLFILVVFAFVEPRSADRYASADRRNDPFSKIIEH